MVKILSLRGDSKMSKSLPDDAIFLTDSLEIITKKIKRAQTADAGNMSDSLQSHVTLIKSISADKELTDRVDTIIDRHMRGEEVMGEFKKVFLEAVMVFLTNFNKKRAEVIANKEKYMDELSKSSAIAIARAKETIKEVYEVLGISGTFS